MSSFGIDLGTTNSVIAHLVEGKPLPIPIAGHAIVPSVVCFTEDNRVVVGREARNLELAHPDRTARSIKRRMGQDTPLEIAGRRLLPEEISAEVLRALKTGAEAATGLAVRQVVITVPAYFDDGQRRATLRAGELAGLEVLRLLNEPTSASLVFDQTINAGASADPEIVLVYDLGGGTFDVSVLEIFGDVREVRATAGNTHLGGDDFDDKLCALFLDELRTRHGVDGRDDPRVMARLRRAAEQTKISLSTDTEAHVREEFLTTAGGQPVHLDVRVTRRQFEDMIRPLLASTVELARRALDDARLEEQQLSRICLVGGSTRIPLVRALLDAAFDVDMREDVDPDLAVGLGAAVQAGLLRGEAVARILVDVTAHSLGIRVAGGADREGDDGDLTPDTFAPIIRRNTVLPAVRAEEFYTMMENQPRVQVEVYQGEAGRASQNTRVGSFMHKLDPAPDHSPVCFKFEYDLSGVVRVSVSQPGLGNEKIVALQVADAAADVGGPAGKADSSLERKALALIERLSGAGKEPQRAKLEELLAAVRSAGPGASRETAEEALLDFFLDVDTEEDE